MGTQNGKEEKSISELKNRLEITQSKQQRENRMKNMNRTSEPVKT